MASVKRGPVGTYSSARRATFPLAAALTRGLSYVYDTLSPIARAIVLAPDVTAVHVYDTAKDSDYGAWRKKVAHTSWMNEPLGTATRGTRAEFPSKVLWVARSNGPNAITGYDLDDPTCPMWKVLSTNASAVPQNAPLRTLTALNGMVYADNGVNGMAIFDLISDWAGIRAAASLYGYNGNLAQLPAALGYQSNLGSGLPSTLVNSIAATVLPHTPPNPLRCDLPNPTVAVGTGAGVSIIRADGVVCNSSSTQSYSRVAFLPNGALVSALTSGTGIYGCLPLSYLAASFNIGSLSTMDNNVNGGRPYIHVAPAALVSVPRGYRHGGATGLQFTDLDLSYTDRGMTAWVSDKFNTGYQHGASKLALAESSADLSDLTGITYGPELITRGSFDKITGWDLTAAGGGGVAGKLSVTSAGKLRLDFTANGLGHYVSTVIDTIPGRTYDFKFDFDGSESLSTRFYVRSISPAATLVLSGSLPEGENVVRFTATTEQTHLHANVTSAISGTFVEFDDFSCKEVIGELVTNGKLDQGTTGWANDSGTEIVSVVAGKLHVARGADGASFQNAKQVISGLTVGRYYLVSLEAVARSGTANFVASFGSTIVGSTATTGVKTALIKATNTSHNLLLGVAAGSGAIGDYVEFDNISVMPLAGIDKPELVTNGHFTTGIDGWVVPSPGNVSGTWEAGRAKLEVLAVFAGAIVGLSQSITGLTVGKVYEAFAAIDHAGSSGAGLFIEGPHLAGTIVNGKGISRLSFVATATSMVLRVGISGAGETVGDVAYIDNISVKEADAGLGANLVTNGGFDTGDLTGWTNSGGGALSVVGGRMTATAEILRRYQDVAVTPGKVYRVRADITEGLQLYVYPGATFMGALGNTPSGLLYVVAPSSILRVYIWSLEAVTATADNIEVREVTDSLIYNGTFDTDASGWSAFNAALSATSGQLNVLASEAFGEATQVFSPAMLAGKTFAYSATLVSGTGRLNIRHGSTHFVPNLNAVGPHTFSGTFTVPSGLVADTLVALRTATSGETSVWDNITLTEIPAELVINGTFNPPDGEALDSWDEAVTGTGTISVANGIATLAGGTGTASITQALTGLVVGQPYRLRLTPSTGPLNVAIAGLDQAAPVGAQAIEFVATATTHDLVLSVGTGETAGVTAVSAQAINGYALFDNFDAGISNWTAALGGALTNPNGRLRVESNGSNFGEARRSFTTRPGGVYRLRYYRPDGSSGTGGPHARALIGSTSGASDLGLINSALSSGPHDVVFTATGATTHVALRVGSTVAGHWVEFDDLTIQEIAADRSVAGNHPVVYGTVTREVVAEGADVASYGGFGTDNYLELPYTSSLDFGTGDFCIEAFIKSDINGTVASRGDGVSAGSWFIRHMSGSTTTLYIHNGTSFQIVCNTAIPQGNNVHLLFARTNGVVRMYANGRLVETVSTAAAALTMTNTSAKLRIGEQQHLTFAGAAQRIALFRVSASAPTADQIKAIYEAELPLFQPNAKALLVGSPNVQSLAYDNDSDKLYAATAAGTNIFRGLQRVGYQQSTAAINKANGTFLGIEVGSSLGTSVGITGTVVGKGVENGLPYIEVQFQGTKASGTSLFSFGMVPRPAASQGQAWAASLYVRHIAGSLSGWGGNASMRVTMRGTNSGGGQAESFDSASYLADLSQTEIKRFGATATFASANTVGALMFYTMRADPGIVIDYTVRIYAPQLEQSAEATTWEPPLALSDNHKAIAAADGIVAIGTAAGVDVFAEGYRRQRPKRVAYDHNQGTHTGVTTDATPTALAHIVLALESSQAFVATVTATDYVSGDIVAEYTLSGTAERDAVGDVTVTSATTIVSEINAAMDCVALADTTTKTLVFRVTGLAATRLVWDATVELSS